MSYSPAALLGELGIPILSLPLPGFWGAWSPVHRKVAVSALLSPLQQRCILAHEVEHVLAGDQACGFGLLTEAQERRADAEASRKLIRLHALAEAAREARCPREVAILLGVTEQCLSIRIANLSKGEPWPATLKIAG